MDLEDSATVSATTRSSDKHGVTPADLLRVLRPSAPAGEPLQSGLNILLHTPFCWDHPQASIDAFCERLNRHEWPAVARLVQAIGLFRSATLMGPMVWHDYAKYSRYIHPTLERGLNRVWQLQKNLGLI